MNQTKSIGAIILAGGQSSRMGQNKADLPFGGVTLLEKILLCVKPHVSATVVMISTVQPPPRIAETNLKNVKIERDQSPFQGPLYGIADGLKYLSEKMETIFVATCDMPYLTREAVGQIIEQISPELDGVITVNQKISNPVLAVYQRHVLENIPHLIASGQRKARDIAKNRTISYLNISTSTNLGFTIADDANSPEQYRKALCDFGFCNAEDPAITIQFKGDLQKRTGCRILPIRAKNMQVALSVVQRICPGIFPENPSIENVTKNNSLVVSGNNCREAHSLFTAGETIVIAE